MASIIAVSKRACPGCPTRGIAEVTGGSRVEKPGTVASLVADRLGWKPEAIANEKRGGGRVWVAYQRARHAPEGATLLV